MKIEKEHFPFSLPVKARLSEVISTAPRQIKLDDIKPPKIQESDPSTPMNEEKLKEIINKINQVVDLYNKQIHFKVHKEAEQLMVQVLDKESDKVLAEYPPKEMLDLSIRIKEVIGLFIDQKG